MSFYNFASNVAKLYFKIVNRVEVIGEERVPKDGGVLFCTNHISNLDPPVMGATSPRQLSFMAKSELFKVPILGSLITALNSFPVNRGKGDRQALKKAAEILNDGNTLLMFPEGSRNKTGKIGQGQSGVGYFALRTNASVVPCVIIGDYRPFHKVKVVYGDPIDFTQLIENKAKSKEATELIMVHLQQLLDQNGKKELS